MPPQVAGRLVDGVAPTSISTWTAWSTSLLIAGDVAFTVTARATLGATRRALDRDDHVRAPR